MNISNLLFEKRKTISQEDLIYLAKESARYGMSLLVFQSFSSAYARSAPPEYHEILNQLLANEREKQAQLQLDTSNPAGRSFGITVPIQLQPSPRSAKVSDSR